MDFKNIFKVIKDTTPAIHKEGHRFIFYFAIAAIFLWAIYEPFGVIGFIATAWCAYFFRDPERTIPVGENLVVSPADGLISKIEKVAPPAELGLSDEKITRISIFLNVFDVHINRTPISGEVTALNYHPGKFLSANLDKASTENERQSIIIKTKEGQEIVCIQIAGMIARRIVCYLEDKQKVEGGARYGLIRFGSRVDVYLPAGVNAAVAKGQRAVGGETILADIKSKSSALKGEVR